MVAALSGSDIRRKIIMTSVQSNATNAYRFVAPEVRRLASLEGAEIDMCAVVDVCIRLEALSDISKSDVVLWEALSSAVVVRYGRCFNKGVRVSLPHNVILAASTEMETTHAFVSFLRDKHVAHSVNPFEENDVAVQIGDHFVSSMEITSVTTAHGRVLGLSFDMPTQLKELAEWWLAWIRTEKEVERNRLLAYVKTIPLKRLKRAPRHVLGTDTGPHNVGKTRKRP